ncbi:LppP/LprE family lipoprotein [uncultured Mycolicibacterium sp.]|uniref:LppP/LprE family lipoprotein n=1 Tax=uncultured Mycolicibacterium sp. TaxID=2320817 RepID=UPI0026196865|nr:LppP/LprE family lipoprotein [uncultured Mycolicibacterium sp.]
MRTLRLITAVLVIGVFAGCGWSPPGTSPSEPDTCTPADGPGEQAVNAALGRLPRAHGALPWQETARGHTGDCRLYWVQAAPLPPTEDGLAQVLFFAGDRFVGTAAPEPRPYLTALRATDDAALVQFQWRQGDDELCCPTGLATVRYTLDEHGELTALDPVPEG